MNALTRSKLILLLLLPAFALPRGVALAWCAGCECMKACCSLCSGCCGEGPSGAPACLLVDNVDEDASDANCCRSLELDDLDGLPTGDSVADLALVAWVPPISFETVARVVLITQSPKRGPPQWRRLALLPGAVPLRI
ncbi:MAG: hypothetical protein ACI841_004778 [Planctomycetota bacterium]|jgi:hypothetical protein